MQSSTRPLSLMGTADMSDLFSPTPRDIESVSPALGRFTRETLSEVWDRPALSRRDRSLVTIAAQVARLNQITLTAEFHRALTHGVTVAELSEVITHMAFYAGWPNALLAVEAALPLFSERGITADSLPDAMPELLPLDEIAEAKRATFVRESAGATAPGVVHYTAVSLFRDLWLRPALKARDRSLITVAALVANGHTAQVPFHLNRALDNGLTFAEASEALTQLAFYCGWPSIFTAIPVFKTVFESRSA